MIVMLVHNGYQIAHCFGIMPQMLGIKSISILLGSIGFAYCFPRLSPKVDLSFGLYLYHMIVVNVMIFMGLGKKEPVWFLIALAVSLLLSAVSYFSLGAISRKLKSAAKAKQSVGQT